MADEANRLQIYSAYLTAGTQALQADSVTAYTDVDTTFRFDFSPPLGGAADASFGMDGVAVVQPSRTTRFTQELRLSTTLGSRTDWLMGLLFLCSRRYGRRPGSARRQLRYGRARR